MRIRIQTNTPKKLRQEILEMAENGEWETWTLVRLKSEDGDRPICRLIHTPSHDNQYRSIRLRLRLPSEEDLFYKESYLDIIPYIANNCDLTDEEIKNKSGIVLGRFCEILNRYFDSIKEYRVLLK